MTVLGTEVEGLRVGCVVVGAKVNVAFEGITVLVGDAEELFDCRTRSSPT